MYKGLSAQIAAIGSMEGQIMGQVQIEDATLNNAVSALQSNSSALEKLSQAVEAFIADNPKIPNAQTADLQAALSASSQALTDAQKAQNDLAAAANPTPAPTPAPDPTPTPTPTPDPTPEP